MTLEEVRRFYSEEIRFAAPLRSTAVTEAFARVPREAFLAPGPWEIGLPDIGMGASSMVTEDADPRHVYHNIPFALDRTRHLFNGQPATIGRWIDALGIQPTDRVFHLGCATGYFTAVMAELAGSVIAAEIDPVLAERASRNLQPYRNVTVHCADGTTFDSGPADCILINAGVALPTVKWLDSLAPGGRMIVPLTVPMDPNLGKGVAIKITRQDETFNAQTIGFIMSYTCTAPRDPQLDAALAKAIATGALFKLKQLRRAPHEPDETCILHTSGICLSSSSN